MIRSRAARAGLAAFVAATASCARCGADAAPATLAPALAIQVEVAGCAAVRRGAICELTPATRELNLWVQAPPDSKLEVTFAGAAVKPAKSKEIDGGTLLVVPVPEAPPGSPPATPVVVIATSAGARGEKTVNAERVPSDEALDRVQALRKAGKLDEAAKAMPPVDSFPEALRGRAKSLSARLALAAGRADEAIEGLRAAMEVHRKDGRVSDEVLDAMALSHTLGSQGRRVSEARETLDSVESALRDWDEGRAQLGYYRAVTALDVGDLRTAWRELRASGRLSARLGLGPFWRRTQHLSAALSSLLGDVDQALTVIRAVEVELPTDASSCERAELMTNRAWYELVALGATESPSPQPHMPRPTSLEQMRGSHPAERQSATDAAVTNGPGPAEVLQRHTETLELWEKSCPRREGVINARTNLALAALEADDPKLAAEHVKAARALGSLPAFVSVWLLEVEARIALAANDARRAVALYDELALRAGASYSPEARWRAAVGRGTGLEAAGDTDAAERAYREAEALLDEQSARVPVNDGRTGFLAHRDRSVRLLVDLLVRRGDAAGAMGALRTARVRSLRATQRLDRVAALAPGARRRWEDALTRYTGERTSLESESASDWAVPADRLDAVRASRRTREEAAQAALDEAFAALAEVARAPSEHEAAKEGELLVAFQSAADHRSVHAFTQDSSGVRVTRLEPVPPDATEAVVAATVLDPLSTVLAAARKVRVLSYGPLAGIDLHALPWRGALLLAHAAVEYPTDFPGAAGREPAGAPTALVVADTRADLPNARGEGATVSVALAPRWQPLRLEGEMATRAAVLSGLEKADLFHFASHASFDGSRGWDSALHLAQGAYLRAGDVLALPHAPAIVVLSACETGKSASSRVADMSLAHAFIAAGSRVVIAASRPVEDRLAAALVARTYEGARERGWDVAARFREAQLEVARSMPETDWRAYRVITR